MDKYPRISVETTLISPCVKSGCLTDWVRSLPSPFFFGISFAALMRKREIRYDNWQRDNF